MLAGVLLAGSCATPPSIFLTVGRDAPQNDELLYVTAFDSMSSMSALNAQTVFATGDPASARTVGVYVSGSESSVTLWFEATQGDAKSCRQTVVTRGSSEVRFSLQVHANEQFTLDCPAGVCSTLVPCPCLGFGLDSGVCPDGG